MSKEFIEKRVNSLSLETAVRQQEQLSYLITSQVQKDIRVDYFEKFAERKYYTSDVFLNWVKQVLKEPNFLSFAKHFRDPNPSSKLINTRVKEPLSRVFFSEDSYFIYQVNGKSIDHPLELEDDFEEKLFDAILFNCNDIIVHDLKDTNRPYREFVDIKKVESIEVNNNLIKKIAYKACVEIQGEKVYGYVYLDDNVYQFYDKERNLLISEEHDYRECPATFVSNQNFDNDPVVKKSVFSYLRAELEEYSFLKTLQRMTDINGAIPITVRVKTKEKTADSLDFDARDGEPMSIEQLGSQVSSEARATAGVGGGSVMQAGTEVTVPLVEKADGSIDMEFAKNFITFYYTPVEALKYLNDRIKELESSIITCSIGDYDEGNDVSMTEMQVSKGYVSREDKLRWLSNSLSFSRKLSDKMMLSLKYGRPNVEVDIFYGSDFFMESQSKLYEMFRNSPNSIERKNILIRLSQRRNIFNKEKSKREVILYKILPYCADKDFETAISKDRVMPEIFEFQTRFTYWVAIFESYFGDIVSFWNDLNESESSKIIILNNLIYELIKKDDSLTKFINNGRETNSDPTSVSRESVVL